MKSILFGNSAVSIGDAIYITIISMSIVFFILFLISFVLSFFKYFSNSEELKQDIINKKRNDNQIVQNSKKSDLKTIDNEKKFSMEKIKDETMMAAMMAALIEAAGDNENCYIRVKNIREIK
ncbi:OadG family protein [Leptotrichia massiliensis]|uniref:OadG family protein n=1 Tax=Leptotrichia massiliensis TaxID=1852388 RepID=UPI0008DADB83|nr:OadG family protein [Leptotrichia massiliensis]